MKDLYFVNPVFETKTLNLTVRKGNKWNNYIGDVKIKKTNTDEEIRTAKIVHTETIKFNELRDLDLKLEHDPKCRTRKGLFNELKNVYNDFNENDIITLVYFILHK